MNTYEHFDKAYFDLITLISEKGEGAADRTSVGSNRKIFGHAFKMNMENVWTPISDYVVPFMECRAFGPRVVFEELMWMLRGQTDARILQAKNISIWDGNTTREFLDKNGLHDVPTGFIGKGYGYQMRNFNGVDQLAKVFDNLKNNPNDRRHIINFWNAGEISEMALPPCHYDYQFVPVGNRLNLRFTLRSNDVVFGLPYNIAFAGMWLVLFSRALDMEPGELMYVGGDVHIYSNQFELAEKTALQYMDLVKNDFYQKPLPKIRIEKELNSLDDILSLEWSDIEVLDFTPQKNPVERPDMAV